MRPDDVALGPRQAHEVVYQDPVTGWRTFDIANGAGWPTAAEAAERKALANAEALGESLRLLYVALTRAEHQTILWWTRSHKSELTGLARLLFARKDGEIDAELFAGERLALPPDRRRRPRGHGRLRPGRRRRGGGGDGRGHRAGQDLAEPLADQAGERILSLQCSTTCPTGPIGAGPSAPWRRELADAEADVAEYSEESPDSEVSDEAVRRCARADEAVGAPPGASDLPLGRIPGGAQFGTLVHEVLEEVDFAAVDLEAELRASIEDKLRWNPWPVEPATLVAGSPPSSRRRSGRLLTLGACATFPVANA